MITERRKPRRMNLPRAAEWLLRLVLRLHPQWFRDRYQDEIVDCFRQEWRDAITSHGALAGLRVFARTALGAVSTAWVQRLRVSGLDFRLGARRLIRYPGVTILSVVSMAFVIMMGAVVFEGVTQIVHPDLGFPDGDRVVGFRASDPATTRADRRLAFDLVRWRNELETVEELGAYRIVPSNLVIGNGVPTVVDAVQINASAFRIANVAPVMGRVLEPEDERLDADPMAVIGHELWVRELGADPKVVGRKAMLGGAEVTIVGVMPQGFAFPVNNELWVPLRMDLTRWGPGEGPELRVFGRLAPDVTLASAQRELRDRGAAVRRGVPGRPTTLTTELVPHPQTILSLGLFSSSPLLSSTVPLLSNIPLLLVALLVVGNVALLVFARAVSRERDIVVRTALGASRSRIVAELFAETLALTIPAVLVGLAFMDFALEQTFRALEADGGKQPYWLTPTISPTTVAYMVVLGVAAALVTALLPGLKLTAISERRQSRGLSSSLSARLNQTASKPAAFRFGGIWNALIIGQIALAVPLTPLVFGMQRELDLLRHPRFGFAAEELVGGSLKLGFDGIDATAPASLEDTSRLYEMRLEQLRQRMLQDPRVVGVGYTERMPGTRTAAWRRQPVQVEGLETTVTPYGTGRWWTSAARVSPDYFSVLGARMLAGREFTSADLSTGDAVIVTEAFVAGALRGGNAIGRRIRVRLERNSAGEDSFGPWLEIVGVVADHGGLAGDIVYEPMTQVSDPVNVIVHAREGRDQVLALLQSTVADVDPTLRLEDPILMEDVNSDNERIGAYLRLVFTTSFGVAVLLAIGGLYAVMSFTVTDRTREIGIRRALGASRTRTLGAVLRRPILQALSGVTVGAGLFFLMQRGDVGDELGLAMSVMLGICLLATLVPARQALRVEPTHALRAEG